MIALFLVAAWCILLNFLTDEALNSGERQFALILGACGLVLAAKFLIPLNPFSSSSQARACIVAVSICAVLPFLYHDASAFVRDYNRPPGSDFMVNTLTAARTNFDQHKNPYETKAEFWWDPSKAPHVTQKNGRLYMFGVPYYYGYPYFPAMILTYEPLRRVVPTLGYIRIGNAIFLLITVVSVVWLAVLLVPPRNKWMAGAIAAASMLCLWTTTVSYFYEGQIDASIPMFTLLGIIAAWYRRPSISGILFGWAFACKLLPGGFLCLIMLAWFWRRPERLKFAIPMVLTFLAVMLPYILWNPPAFLSATILYYLTEHVNGDDTALYYYLPEAAKALFIIIGYSTVGAILVKTLRNKTLGLADAVGAMFISFMVFVAFSKMDHPNYFTAITPLGSVALVALTLRERQTDGIEAA